MRLLVQRRLLPGHQVIRPEPGPLQEPLRRAPQERGSPATQTTTLPSTCATVWWLPRLLSHFLNI